MFSKLTKQENTRPSVTKASSLINKKSHKQKKYISLMVVPSYSNGKTRTLRMPRGLFHGAIAALLVVTAIVLGFYFNSMYHQRIAQNLESSLVETENRYYEFRAYAEQTQDDLIETAAQIFEELTETEARAQAELSQQAESHQTELESVLSQIENIEEILRIFDQDRQAAISGISTRSQIIPPLVPLLAELEAAQAALKADSHIHNPTLVTETMGMVQLGGGAEAGLQQQLDILTAELNVQMALMDNLAYYRNKMDIYLSNFPTLWPVSGAISSGFGWRSNPFGRGGGEHHTGVDIPARTGTNIRAAGGGIVTSARWHNGYGNTIIIYHGNGISTLYAHNSRNIAVEGQRVERGEVIALVGSTGRTTGAHLHFEVKINGTPVNPVPYMNEHY